MSNIFIPKWNKAQQNGTQFMKNLDRHLRYEVDLEKYEAKKREIECGKENQHGGQIEGLGQLKGTVPAREYFRWHQYKEGCWEIKPLLMSSLGTTHLSKQNHFPKSLSSREALQNLV